MGLEVGEFTEVPEINRCQTIDGECVSFNVDREYKFVKALVTLLLMVLSPSISP